MADDSEIFFFAILRASHGACARHIATSGLAGQRHHSTWQGRDQKEQMGKQ